jgi:hypothetical protein
MALNGREKGPDHFGVGPASILSLLTISPFNDELMHRWSSSIFRYVFHL